MIFIQGTHSPWQVQKSYYKYSEIPVSRTLISSHLPITRTKSRFPLPSRTLYVFLPLLELSDFSNHFSFPWEFWKIGIPIHLCQESSSRLAHVEKFSLLFSSSSFVILILIFSILNHPCSFMVCIYLVFFYLIELLFSGFFQFKGDFVHGQNTMIELLTKSPTFSRSRKRKAMKFSWLQKHTFKSHFRLY